MGCATCSNKIDGVPNGCKSNGSCGNGGCSKLTTFNWLANMALPANTEVFNCVEVRFKNGRKDEHTVIQNKIVSENGFV